MIKIPTRTLFLLPIIMLKEYNETAKIKLEFIKNKKRALIRARIDKSKEEQRIR